MVKKTLIIVGGPTGSGKTSLAHTIFENFDAEFINADSRQVYKYFDIGTNKGDITLLNDNVKINKHILSKCIVDSRSVGWGFDFLEPHESFSVGDYKTIAKDLIEDIHKRGKLPILVGGTGLYIDALLKNYDLKDYQPDKALRRKLNSKSINQLQSILVEKNFDLDILNNSDRNNPVRLIRYIEKLSKSKKPFIRTTSLIREDNYKTLFLYPEFKREELFNKIDIRVNNMFNSGLIKEVKELIDNGYKNTKPMKGIGYKEVVAYLEGQINKKECINLIQISHRQYAKRQVTWFEGKNRNYKLIQVKEDNIISKVSEFI